MAHLQLNCFEVFHGDLKVDWRLRDGFGGEADIESVLPKTVLGDALIVSEVRVVNRFNCQS